VPRRAREEVPGGIHHLYARGNRQQLIYLDDRDRLTYLRILGLVVADRRWRCLAYCLMDNHVHLVVETPEPNLAAGMQYLHGTYGRVFNDRHGRTGHLFQGRYGAKAIRSDPQLWAVVRYVAMNPVTAGLCPSPDQWSWGSCGRRPPWLDHGRLLQYLGAAGGDPWRRYAELTATNPQPS
jgi:REP-associated tyrosine transposase